MSRGGAISWLWQGSWLERCLHRRIFDGCLSSNQLSWLGKIPELAGGLIWPDGEMEAVKGFITEHDAARWIAEHSQATAPVTCYRQGSN